MAVLALPGLRNEAGEFNCFLNVVLQVGASYSGRYVLMSNSCAVWRGSRDTTCFLNVVLQVCVCGIN